MPEGVPHTPVTGRASGPVILCYDGSKEAVEAVEYAAALLPGRQSIVVTVWKPIIEEALAAPGPAPPIGDPVDANERERKAAATLASDGAARASKAGLKAEPVAIEASGPIWAAIEKTSEDLEALLIVCSTSRNGVRFSLPGSVARALVQNASRPVVVVPSAAAAAERRREFRSSRFARVGAAVEM
jgi:nucleotide-binding universal stress UspA family protein